MYFLCKCTYTLRVIFLFKGNYVNNVNIRLQNDATWQQCMLYERVTVKIYIKVCDPEGEADFNQKGDMIRCFFLISLSNELCKLSKVFACSFLSEDFNVFFFRIYFMEVNVLTRRL
jgi:hypothetical protein